jgi:hypothetical protein
MSRDQTPRPNWRGLTALVLGSGPSFRASDAGFRWDRLDKVRTIAINATAFSPVFSDINYFGDFLFAKAHVRELQAKRPYVWTCDKTSAERWGYNWVKGTNRPGLASDAVNMNGNSGAQAINLAYLFGARRIVLLGFDMKLGPKGEKHHHPDHPAPLVQEQLFDEWIHKFEPLARDLAAAGVEVINCTPGSALPCFPMATLEETMR